MSPERLLDAVGLTETEERIYRALLSRPDATADELAAVTALEGREAQVMLESLAEKGLASFVPHERARYMASPPESAVDALILRHRERLERAHVNAVALMREFRRGVGAGTTRARRSAGESR
jgi:sugar-specific transcriptional regulator TrmB